MQNHKTLKEAISELKHCLAVASVTVEAAKKDLNRLSNTLEKCKNLEIVKAYDKLEARKAARPKI